MTIHCRQTRSVFQYNKLASNCVAFIIAFVVINIKCSAIHCFDISLLSVFCGGLGLGLEGCGLGLEGYGLGLGLGLELKSLALALALASLALLTSLIITQ